MTNKDRTKPNCKGNAYQVNCILPAELHARLLTEAEDDDRTLSNMLRVIIKRYFQAEDGL
jgi:hypothetical protein